MSLEDLNKVITYIVDECVKLKDKYVAERDLIVDYVCIFTHSQNEYNELIQLAEQIGRLVDDTKTGPVYSFNNPPETIAGKPKLLKIRKPDETRLQRGDVDFKTDYSSFKEKYLDNNRFTLIKRENSEMIELKDDDFDALAYFSNIPTSKRLGIN
jgi:hypothetical protein